MSPPGTLGGAGGAAAWRRLGFLSLDPNEQSGHQVAGPSSCCMFLDVTPLACVRIGAQRLLLLWMMCVECLQLSEVRILLQKS